jgi:hypothetical protein
MTIAIFGETAGSKVHEVRTECMDASCEGRAAASSTLTGLLLDRDLERL